jgi:hypothetical protein
MTARKPRRALQLGVSDEQYERLLAAQGGHCALCPNTPKTRRLAVDHEHRTGRVRGLLCHRCNRVLPTWITAGWLCAVLAYLPGNGPNLGARLILDEINGTGKDD